METEEYQARELAEMFVSDLEKSEGKKYSEKVRNKIIRIYMAGYMHE